MLTQDCEFWKDQCHQLRGRYDELRRHHDGARASEVRARQLAQRLTAVALGANDDRLGATRARIVEDELTRAQSANVALRRTNAALRAALAAAAPETPPGDRAAARDDRAAPPPPTRRKRPDGAACEREAAAQLGAVCAELEALRTRNAFLEAAPPAPGDGRRYAAAYNETWKKLRVANVELELLRRRDEPALRPVDAQRGAKPLPPWAAPPPPRSDGADAVAFELRRTIDALTCDVETSSAELMDLSDELDALKEELAGARAESAALRDDARAAQAAGGARLLEARRVRYDDPCDVKCPD